MPDANRTAASESTAIASSALTLYASDAASQEQSEAAALSTTSTSAPVSANSLANGSGNGPASAGLIKRIDSTALEASAVQLVDEVFEDIDGLLNEVPAYGEAYPAAPGGSSFTTNVFIPPRAQGAETPSALSTMVMLWGLFPAIAGGLCLGLALAFGIATGGRQVAAPPDNGQPAASDIDPETGEFLAYLDQSLDKIEPSSPRVTEMPLTVPALPELKRPPSPTATALPPTPFAGAVPQLPPVNVPSALPTVPVQPLPARLPQPSPTVPTPIAAPEPAPAASSAPSQPAPETSPEPIANISPSPHVLVGLLQLGDRSAAIFEFDDGARRIRVGEAIGSSGWSLVSISQDEAVIRRNGDVRSIYIGQSI
ncbi:MAG: hypothetical protein AAF289_22375 [Cyanobacteria bacterium P01_A01_bin.135]